MIVTTIVADPSFLGALLGAIITGLIAIRVMWLQTNYDKKKKLKEDNRNFLKVLTLIESKGRSFYSLGKNIVDLNYDENHITLGSLESMEKIRQAISMVDHNHVPQEYYEDFINFQSFLETLLKNIKAGINKEHGSEGNSEMLETFNNDINSFVETKQKLQKKI
ncbi:hypothetical protein GLW07_18930 [Bacillus hwajinpoensis]|uniref:Uncharacterized protein n=1 Tax=Guptibacillus hwajinpoensis TaxID=208199 RepID=A0A845F468_9BACL|nr:hypothetical protein [Pseudalkalibacillus hwajinpoensis]MYL65437.1 hypothetical protein [Pseudalkalibacillus hwajinpoensis]